MIGFAIIGLLSIIVVNILFYRELKKTFKDRKLIWYLKNLYNFKNINFTLSFYLFIINN